MQKILLSTAYLPPIQYVSKFMLGDVAIERHENYSKQSFRNRCNILAANGVISLTIPIVKEHGLKSPISETRIEYDLPWQKIHYKSIKSAYKSSPYYDYYIDELEPFYSNRYELLLEYNTDLLRCILKLIGIDWRDSFTCRFEKNIEEVLDFRHCISPKVSKNMKDSYFESIAYYQVFEDRFGFTPNLSVLDLLFNEGPLAKSILDRCIKKGE